MNFHAANKTQAADRQSEGAGPDPPRALVRPFWQDLLLLIVLNGLTVAALYWIFPPRELWLLAFVALVPWALAVCRVTRPWLIYWGTFLFGWLFFLVSLRWMMPVTGLGFV